MATQQKYRRKSVTEQEYFAEKKRLADKMIEDGMPRSLVDNCIRSIERQSREDDLEGC